MERRSGADPPSIMQIQDHEEQTEKQQQQKAPKTKGRNHPKPKIKQRGKMTKKKRRLSGQQQEGKGWSHVNPKRSLKRQRTDRTTNIADSKQDSQEMAEDIASQQPEQQKQGKMAEYVQDSTSVEEDPPGQQKQWRSEDKPVKGKHGRKMQSFTSPQYEDVLKKKEINTNVKQYQPEVPSGKGEMEKEIQKEGQQSPPKKRQRTIFEFAGMRIQDRSDRPSQIEALETSGEHMESNTTDSDKIARTDQ